jgi:hypothetical protein
VFSEGKATALIKKNTVYKFKETVIPFKFNIDKSEFKMVTALFINPIKLWNLMFDDEKTFQLFIDSSGKEINGKSTIS